MLARALAADNASASLHANASTAVNGHAPIAVAAQSDTAPPPHAAPDDSSRGLQP